MRDVRRARVVPSASRLTASLRSVGYEPSTAVADLVDNSVSAGATEIAVVLSHDGPDSFLRVIDNGHGMGRRELKEAMRFGTVRKYDDPDLGRFGLGMKTAALSMGRRLTVASSASLTSPRFHTWKLDLSHIEEADEWEILNAYRSPAWHYAREQFPGSWRTGTVVMVEDLDRLLPGSSSTNGYGRRRMDTAARQIRGHLGMVFHRFLERKRPLCLTVNGEQVLPWNPFAPGEEHLAELDGRSFRLDEGGVAGEVTMRRFILPNREDFSSPEQFDSLGRGGSWNRLQGLYIYRADRMIQSGGWCGLRGIDEHLKMARASIDFGVGLDGPFEVDIAKKRVRIPQSIRKDLKEVVDELCRRADERYRHRDRGVGDNGSLPEVSGRNNYGDISSALISAASETGTVSAFGKIMRQVRQTRPGVAEALNW